MVTKLSGVIGAKAAGGMVAEDERKSQAVAVTHRVESHLGAQARCSRSAISYKCRSRPASSGPHAPADKVVSQEEDIDSGSIERSQRIGGCRHERFLIVERSVENERHAAVLLESLDKRMEEWILVRVYELDAAGAVTMQHGRDSPSLLGSNRIGKIHEAPVRSGPGPIVGDQEPALGIFSQH